MHYFFRMISIGMVMPVLSCMGQKNYRIVKTNTYATLRMVGNIPVDDTGKPIKNGPDTTYTVYVETKGTQLPEWKMAYNGYRQFSVSAEQVTNGLTEVGVDEKNGTLIKLKPAAGSRLWKIELEPSENFHPAKNLKNIILVGLYRKTEVKLALGVVTTLQSPAMP